MKRLWMSVILVAVQIVFSGFRACGQQFDTTWVSHFTYPTGRATELFSCIERDGYLYYAGRSATSPYDDFLIGKMNATNGQTVWVRNHGSRWNENDVAYGICLDDSSMVYAIGRSLDSSGGIWATVIKCEPVAGDTIWVRNYRVASERTCIGFCGVYYGGSLYVCGLTGTETIQNTWLAKIDPANGDTIWNSVPDVTPGYDNGARSISCDPTGNLYLAGYLSSEKLLTMKCDPFDGAVFWMRAYETGGGWSLNGYTVVYRDGALYAAGDADSGVAATTALAKINPANGDTFWIRRDTACYSNARARGCVANSNGDVIVVGYGFNSMANHDLMVWKHQPDGELVSTYRYNGNSFWGDGALACAIDAADDLYAAGMSVEDGVLTGLLMKLEESIVGIAGDPPRGSASRLSITQRAIRFMLGRPGMVSLSIYNTLGRRVRSLITNQRLAAGQHEISRSSFDRLASGVYLVRLRVGEEDLVGRLLIVK